MAWIDINAPGSASWSYSQTAYYDGKIYIPDAANLRIYTINNDSWSTKAMPGSVSTRGCICIDLENEELYIAGNGNFYKYTISDESFTVLSKLDTGSATSRFFTFDTTDFKRIYFYRKNIILGVHYSIERGYEYTISTDRWHLNSTSYSVNYDTHNDAGLALPDRRYFKWQGWFRAQAGSSRTYVYKGVDDLGPSAGLSSNFTGGFGPNYLFAPTVVYQGLRGGNLQRSDGGNFTTVSTGYGSTYDPVCWAEGYVFQWNTAGTVGKKWEPAYKVSGDATYWNVEVIVFDNNTNYELGRTYSRPGGSWEIGLESNDLVNIVAYHPDGSLAAPSHTGVTPVSTS